MRPRPACGIALAAALLAAVSGAGAQTGSAALLGGPPPPQKLRDLDASWWRVVVTLVQQPGAAPTASGGGMMGALQNLYGAQPLVCYTRGETKTIGDRTFLVALRPHPTSTDLTALMTLGAGGQAPSMQKVLDLVAPAPTPDSPLDPTLVDLGGAVTVDASGPFDLAAALQERSGTIAAPLAIQAAVLFPVFAQARLKAQETSSVSNLKEMAIGAIMYSQDYDEHLPPMKDATTLKRAIYPYVKSNEIFMDPRTHQAYHVNVALSRKSLGAIAEPAQCVLFYEPEPAPDGTRAVAFVDGHVKRVDDATWQRLRKLSGME